MSETTSRREKRQQAQQFLQSLTGATFPNSTREWLSGSREDIRVPVRMIHLSPTLNNDASVYEENPSIPIYDTSGPFGDPASTPNVYEGIATLRAAWIAERMDSEAIKHTASDYIQQRLSDATLETIRFQKPFQFRKARAGACITQLHYARRGIITPKMEFIAVRENLGRATLPDSDLLRQHPGAPFCSQTPREITAEFVRQEVAAGRAIIPANITPPLSQNL